MGFGGLDSVMIIIMWCCYHEHINLSVLIKVTSNFFKTQSSNGKLDSIHRSLACSALACVQLHCSAVFNLYVQVIGTTYKS